MKKNHILTHAHLPRRLLFLLPILLLVSAAVIYLNRPRDIPVALVQVEKNDVEASISNTRAGTVKACKRAKMAPPAGGQIAELYAHKGDRVRKGQILLRLWSKDLRAQQRLAQDQLVSSQTQMEQACIQADTAEKEAQRAHQLQAQGYISPQALEQKDSAAKVARAGCISARSQIDQSRSRIDVASASLERMVLRAPFSGIVADISGEQGEYATPSPPGTPMPPTIDLIDDSCMYVSAPIDEVDAARLKMGQPARILLDAIKDRHFTGKVRRIAPYVQELEKQARTVEVEVEFMDRPEEQNLLVGYSADVEIVYERHAAVLRVPTQALIDGKRVLRYREDGTLEEREVKVGLSNWEYSEITEGLTAGDKVVLSLDRPGVKVKAHVVPDPTSPSP